MKRRRKMISLENTRRAPWPLVLLAMAVLPFAGCAVGPKYHPPVVQAPPAYKEIGDWKPAQPNDQNLGGDWWKIFQDPQLDALELQVNVSNQNLKAAEAQFRQARAALRYNRADYYPTVTAGLSATRTRVSAHRPPPSSIFDGITYNDFTLPFDVSYQADVWGRVRKNVESYREQAQASAADLATVDLSMHADLAIDYFQARSLDAQEQLLNSTVKQYEQALELNQSRFEGGIASEVEVEQAKTQLQTTRAAAIDVGVLRAQFEHAVAILIGNPPAEFSLPPLPLTAPPPRIPVSVPSELLERRPDIAAAERRVASANAQIGVAKAAYYPSLNLFGNGGWQAADIAKLANVSSTFWALGANVAESIFTGGARRAQVEFAESGYDVNVANYRQSVLTAFQEVQDDVTGLTVLGQARETQQQAVDAARRTLDLSLDRYRGGLVSYLDVVTAQQNLLNNEQEAAVIQGQRLVTSVLLVKALGGGWDASSLAAVQVKPKLKDVVAP